MKWHSALPGEGTEKCGTLIFLIGWKRDKVEDQKVCERQGGERNGNEHQQAMILFGLQQEADGWNDVRDMRGKGEFAEAAIDEADWGNGVGKNKDE